MSIQKINIQLPQRFAVANPFISRPLPPMPQLVAVANNSLGLSRQHSQPVFRMSVAAQQHNNNFPVLQSMQGQFLASPGIPGGTHLVRNNVRMSISPEMLRNQAQVPVRDTTTRIGVITPERTPSRPRSPNISFNYVAASKQARISSEGAAGNEQAGRGRVQAREQGARGRQQEEQEEVKTLIDGLRSQTQLERNVFGGQIGNNFYGQEDKLKQKQKQKADVSLQRDSVVKAEIREQPKKQPEPKAGAVKAPLQPIEQIPQQQPASTKSQKQLEEEAAQLLQAQRRRSSLRRNDQQLKLMMQQYESLKFRETEHEQMAKVQSNSSSDSEQSLHQVKNSKDHQQKASNPQHNNVKMEHANVDRMRFQKKQGLLHGRTIDEEQEFLIEGVQNVRSEMVEIVNESLDSNRMRISDRSEVDSQPDTLRLREKDLEIKNLKNQMWLMKLRENELMATIRRLEQANKQLLSRIP